MSQPVSYPRVAALKTAPQFLARLAELGVTLPFDDTLDTGPEAPLAQAVRAGGLSLRNRFSILPMEGWDGTPDGRPSDLTRRRWGRRSRRNFRVRLRQMVLSHGPNSRAGSKRSTAFTSASDATCTRSSRSAPPG